MQKPLETVIIRDIRFISNINRSVVGTPPVMDQDDPDWRFDYFPPEPKTEITFFGVTI